MMNFPSPPSVRLVVPNEAEFLILKPEPIDILPIDAVTEDKLLPSFTISALNPALKEVTLFKASTVLFATKNESSLLFIGISTIISFT